MRSERSERGDKRGASDGNAGLQRRRVKLLEDVRVIDTRDYELLRRFVTEHGKIMPSRFTGASPKQQRLIARAIRRARVMGILR